MAAATAVFQSLLPGDHVLVPRVLYWGMRKWLADFALAWGLDVEFTDTTDLAGVAAAIRPGRTRLLWLDTPANPMWEITDLTAVCDLAHAVGVRVAVDNTVATPVHTRPFGHGADLVVHFRGAGSPESGIQQAPPPRPAIREQPGPPNSTRSTRPTVSLPVAPSIRIRGKSRRTCARVGLPHAHRAPRFGVSADLMRRRTDHSGANYQARAAARLSGRAIRAWRRPTSMSCSPSATWHGSAT